MTRGRALPPEVLAHIVKRTDGVPLYIEELTKTLLESGALEPAGDGFELSGPLPLLSIPESLDDSPMARLYRRSGVKDIAHLAATLGRAFSHELLTAASPLDEAAAQEGARPADRRRADLSARRTAGHHLRVQARAGAGRRLQQPAAQQAPAAPPANRQDPRRALPRDRRDQARAARPPLSRGARCRPRPSRSAMQRGQCRDRALRIDRGARALPGGARPLALAAAFGERLRARRSRPRSSSRASPRTAPTSSRTSGTLSRPSRSRRRSTTATSLCRIEYWMGRINYVFGRFDPRPSSSPARRS